MKRAELLKHLRQQGCDTIREGGRHSWWRNNRGRYAGTLASNLQGKETPKAWRGSELAKGDACHRQASRKPTSCLNARLSTVHGNSVIPLASCAGQSAVHNVQSRILSCWRRSERATEGQGVSRPPVRVTTRRPAADPGGRFARPVVRPQGDPQGERRGRE